MASFLSSNGRISANFNNVNLRLSTHVQEEQCSYCCLWAQESHWLLSPLPI